MKHTDTNATQGRPFNAVLFLADWDNIDAHCAWLAAAPIEEIVEWAEIAMGG